MLWPRRLPAMAFRDLSSCEVTWRLNRWLLALVLIFGLPYYWLLLDTRIGDAQPKPLSITDLRALAGSIPGPLPSEVRVELISYQRVPGNLVAAGAGLKRRVVGRMMFELAIPGAGPVIIDSGPTAAGAKELADELFDPGARARADAAMRRASLIVVTQENADHIGGIAELAKTPAILRAKFNPVQAAVIRTTGQPAIAATGAQAVAPGIVVILAPSHTPGSQMIYARLADGKEYLFAGDIATTMKSWQETRARSRLLSQYFAAHSENRREVFSWLLTIRKLAREAPDLKVVPGHDFDALNDPENHFGIQHRFAPE